MEEKKENEREREVQQEYKSGYSTLQRIFAVIGAVALLIISIYLFKIIDILK